VKSLICHGLCLLALVGVVALEASAEMTQYKSRRYIVHTDLPKDQAKPIRDHMDKVFDEYRRRLSRAGFTMRRGANMNLYLFKDQKGYIDGLAKFDVNGTGSGGMFFVNAKGGGLAVWLGHRAPADFYSTLQHEGFHQFAFATIGRMPTWANEGLAEYFGDALLVKGRFELGRVHPHRLAQLKSAIKQNKQFGFGELLNMSSEEWIGRLNKKDERVGLMYTQSWSIVHFLVHGNNGRYERRFMAYLRELARGRGSEQAFAIAFGSADYEPFEKAWRAYIEQLTADPLTIAVERINFMADGLLALHQRGKTPESIEQLQTELQRIRYRLTTSSHGNRKVMDANDDDNFAPPPADRRGREVKVLLLEPEKPDQPPRVQITGLKSTVGVVWSRDDDGVLAFKVELQ